VRRDVSSSSNAYWLAAEFNNLTNPLAHLSGLQPGTIYTIRVLAVFDGYEGDYFEILQATRK